MGKEALEEVKDKMISIRNTAVRKLADAVYSGFFIQRLESLWDVCLVASIAAIQ